MHIQRNRPKIFVDLEDADRPFVEMAELERAKNVRKKLIIHLA